MDRRTFLRSVIIGTLTAPFVTRQVQASTHDWSGPATNPYWQRQMQPVDQTAAFENLQAVMRQIHAQCRRDYQRNVYDMDRIQHAVTCEIMGLR